MVHETGKSVDDEFERVLERSVGRVPVCVQSDERKKFISRKCQSILKKYNVMYKPATSIDSKAAYAERFIKTIKKGLWQYFTYKRFH